MGNYGHVSLSLSVLVLVSLVVPNPTPCSKCQQGHIPQACMHVPCCNGSYFKMKQKSPICEACTKPCEDKEDLVEIQQCNGTFHRVCHCRNGYYCSSSAQYTCRRCMRCPLGTFSSTTSLMPKKDTCKTYTNCTSLGLVIIAKGTNTNDHQCGPASKTSETTIPTTEWTSSAPPTPSSAVASKVLDLTDTLTPPVTPWTFSKPSPQDPDYTISKGSSSRLSNITISQGPASIEASQRPASIEASQRPASIEASQTPAGSRNSSPGQSLWLLIFACVLLLAALLAGFCRGRRMKKLQEYCGLAATKENLQIGSSVLPALLPQSPEQPLLAMEPLYTENKEVLVPDEVESVCRGRQQITVDHSGGGESVKNTVGSIYIYSPGMVVLGANSSERREEPAEGQPFISTPQQESLTETVTREPWARAPNMAPLADGMQEEDHKLSYPVPATGK